MSGYAIVTGHCIACKRIFSFNPVRVPSSAAVTGKREPICADCIKLINENRREKGLPEWSVPADAYEPVSVSEL